jgi:maltose phosphorylase
MIPEKWKSYSFQIFFKEQPVHIHVSGKTMEISNLGTDELDFNMIEQKYTLTAGQKQLISIP